jgi:predicted transcriptional regulator
MVDEETKNKIFELRDKGMTVKQISESLGIKEYVVSYVLKKNPDKFKNKKRLGLTKEEKKKILELRKKGIKRAEIAKIINRSLTAVSAFLVRHDLKIKQRKWSSITDEEKKLVIEKRKEGLSLWEIHKITRLSTTAIAKILKEAGIPTSRTNLLNKESIIKNVHKVKLSYIILIPPEWIGDTRYVVAKRENNSIILAPLEKNISLANEPGTSIRRVCTPKDHASKYISLPSPWCREINIKKVLLKREGDFIRIEPFTPQQPQPPSQPPQPESTETEKLKKELEKKQEEINLLNVELLESQKEISELNKKLEEKQKQIENFKKLLNDATNLVKE